MNYLKQLNSFHKSLLVNLLDANSQCLYYNLLYINNSCNWIKEFTVANSTLMGLTDLNKQQLYRARNNLIQKGYIDFVKGKNQTESGRYTIINLVNDTANDTATNTANDTATNTANDTATNTANDTATNTATNTNNKQNININKTNNKENIFINKNIKEKNFSFKSISENQTKNDSEKSKGSKKVYGVYGQFENVKLTSEELEKLKSYFPDYSAKIDALSSYIASKGKKYKNHYATILAWARRDGWISPMQKENTKKEIKKQEEEKKKQDKINDEKMNAWINNYYNESTASYRERLIKSMQQNE